MNHYDLILFMETLGYPIKHGNGVCQGFTLMWVQAACINKLDAFYKRLEFLERFVKTPDKMAAAIADARRKVLKKNPLTPEDELLLELPAFFDGINLYQDLHQDLANDVDIQFQNVERISTWIRPDCAPDRLHQVSCKGQYTEQEFSDFLRHLASVLENHPGSVLTVSIPTHTLGLFYIGDGLFKAIDTNINEMRPSRPLTITECADLLFNYAFQGDLLNKKLILRTTAFARNPDHLPDLSFEHQKKYTHLHINPDKISLMEWALLEDDLVLWEQLNPNNIPLEKMEVRAQNALLRIACLRGHELMVRLCLQQGMNNYHAQFEQDGLLAAIENPIIMALLLQQGLNPNTMHPSGATPLQSAVRKNKPELVKLLLSHGTTIDYATNTLHFAAEQGHQKTAHILLTYFPQLARVKDKNQLRPLDYAIKENHHELILELLPHTPMQLNDFFRLCEQLETKDKKLKKCILIEAFTRYVNQRQQEFKPLSTLFSCLGRGYAEREKIAVATKVLEFLKTNATKLELEPRELDILNDGRLHQLLRAVRDHLGLDFEIKGKSLKEYNPFFHHTSEDVAYDGNGIMG